MAFKFGFNANKEANKQDDDFKISETLLFKELPESISKQFIEVYTIIKSNREYLKEDKILEIENKEKEMLGKIDNMKTMCTKNIFMSINSFGHQIDNGMKILKEFQNSLKESQNDMKDDNFLKSFPSPILVRYSEQLQEVSESLSEEIEAYTTYLQSFTNTNSNNNICRTNKENVLYNFFNEEYEALLRSSTKISHLCTKLSYTRSLLCKKLKIDQSKLVIESEDTHDSVFQTIQTKYRQFLENKNAQMKRSVEESDIFGRPTKVEAQAAPKPFFASTTSSFVNKRTNNNPAFTPPPMVNTQTIAPTAQNASNKMAAPKAPRPDQKSPFSLS